MHVHSSSSVYVSWLPPDIQFWNGVVTNYTVTYINLGVVGEGVDEDSADRMPTTVSIPQPGQTLMNAQNPTLVSLPLRAESVFIDQLEEYCLYSFTVNQVNIEGVGPLSEIVTQEMPQGGTFTFHHSHYSMSQAYLW